MKRLAGISLGVALSAAALAPLPAAAGPFGAVAELRNSMHAPIVDVRHRRSHGRHGGAAAAGALIGAAIIGGAIIANSQRGHQHYGPQYYTDDAYYGSGPYYGNRGYAVQPQPQPYYYGGASPRVIYTPDKEMPYTYAPSPRYYQGAPRRHRFARDPAGGGTMK